MEKYHVYDNKTVDCDVKDKMLKRNVLYVFNTQINGSNILDMYINIHLPAILEKANFEYAWTKNIGCKIIKNIKLFQTNNPEIFLSVCLEDLLFIQEFLPPSKRIGMKKMLGNVNELTQWNKVLPDYELFIPIMNNKRQIKEKFGDEVISVQFEFIDDFSEILMCNQTDDTLINLRLGKLYITYLAKK